MKIEIRPAVPADAEMIVMHLREYDRKLFDLQPDPIFIVRWTLQQATESYIGFIDDSPICVCFVQVKNFCAGRAKIGVLTMEDADKHCKVFARYTRQMFEMFWNRYEELSGEVDPAYTRSMRWLRWLGFTIEGNTFYRRRA